MAEFHIIIQIQGKRRETIIGESLKTGLEVKI